MRAFLPLCAALLLLAAVAAGAADQKQMSVTVKSTEVRATAGYLGKVLGSLAYGDRVTILEQPAAPKGWVKVLGPDRKLQGWVNLAALTDKVVKLASTSGVTQEASGGDVALAGKGFNADVEAQYKKDKNLDYTWVDRMVALSATPQQVADFLALGGLSEQGGAP